MLGPGINSRDVDILKDLGIVSQLRGADGAGLFQTRSQQKSIYRMGSPEALVKTEGSWMELMEDINYENADTRGPKILYNYMADLFMCHVRQPTKGLINEANAHPYIFDNLVGAHNGTFKDLKYQDLEKKLTDSYLFYKDVSENGLVPVIKGLDPKSAWAITMYDRNSGNFYIGRNDKRPLWISVLKNREVVYWASERIFLDMTISRNTDEPYETYRIENNHLYCMQPHTPKKYGKLKISTVWYIEPESEQEKKVG